MVHEIKESFQMIEETSQKLTNSLEKYTDNFLFSPKEEDTKPQMQQTPMKVPTSILKPHATVTTLKDIEEEDELVEVEKDGEEDLMRKRNKSLEMLGFSQVSSFNSVKTFIN